MAKFLFFTYIKNETKNCLESNKKNQREKKSTPSLGHLKFNGKLIADKKQIANLLASIISNNSSSQHFSQKFQAIKMHTKKK